MDIDEYDVPRFEPGDPAIAKRRGHAEDHFPLTYVRVDPFVIPKRSLTGENTERVDTRVLQVIYAIHAEGEHLYVGQQLDVFIDASSVSAIPTSPHKRLPTPLARQRHLEGTQSSVDELHEPILRSYRI